MSLFNIKDKLYKKKAPENLSEHDKSPYNPQNFQESPEKKIAEEDLWIKKKKGLNAEEKKIIKKGALILGGLLLVVLIVVVGFEIKKMLFNQGDVTVSISGSQQASSGKLLTYEINYKNDKRVDMKNVVIQVTYPQSFKPENNANFKENSPTLGSFNVGMVKRKSQGKVILNGKNFSPKGALIYLRAKLLYQPVGFSGQYEVKSQLGINVTSTPVTLEIQAPQNIASGDKINYLVTYQNNGDVPLNNLVVKMAYPDEFTFSNASPKAMESNNIWYLGNLEAHQSSKILVSGKLEGIRSQVKTVKAQIGTLNKKEFVSYNDEKAETKIVSSPLSIAQTVNGLKTYNANAGDSLKFLIKYKNEGSVGLRNVIVKEKLDSPVLDYTSLSMSGGSFDSANKMITWKASDIPALKNLEPNQSGTIRFNIKVKNILPMQGANDKNFIIASVAKIDSPDIPTPISMNKIISSNTMDIKVNSKLILEVQGYYNDYNIPNSGPNPPKVDQETTYTLRWKVTNVSNDIIDAKVESVLPTGTTMTGKIFPNDARIVYNSRNNSIIWNIGKLKSGTGILSPTAQASFQVKIKPAPNQIRRNPGLLGISTLTAKDAFTNEILKTTANSLNNGLIKDLVGKESRVEE